MREIKKVDKKSFAKILAIVYAVLGFFITIGTAIITIINIAKQADFAGSVIMMTLFNVGAGLIVGIIIALLASLFGYLVGYVFALVYNIVAKKIGGVKIELTDDNK